jgi:ATP-dependent helicase HepA
MDHDPVMGSPRYRFGSGDLVHRLATGQGGRVVGEPRATGDRFIYTVELDGETVDLEEKELAPGPRFRVGDCVLPRANRSQVGRISEEPVRDGGDWWYRVRFANRADNLIEDDLDPLDDGDRSIGDLARRGRWGRLEAFRLALTVERIARANRSTVYTFNAHRVLFHPYQYKPLLRFLDSEDRRLLIADEVGLGKTIEAGMILAELEARGGLDRVLVVCPSRLREKWCGEINRKFGQDFEIYDRSALLQYLTRVRQNPMRSRLRGVISMQTMRNEELLDEFAGAIQSVDLLVVDEAHHARNRGSLISEMLRQLCPMGRAVLLLTATPVHLGSEDLFTLLNALRPKQFPDFKVFEPSVHRHEGVLTALAGVRSRDSRKLGAAAKNLEGVFRDEEGGTVRDPVALQVIESIQAGPPGDRRAWIELERRVESLHLLAGVLTRTRKRDVQEDAPVRKSKVYLCSLTPEEERLYREIAENTGSLGWPSGALSIGQIQKARQAASCLPAAARYVARPEDDPDELCDVDLPQPGRTRREPGEARRRPVWPHQVSDSKFDKLLELLRLIREAEPGAKVLVFTYFVETSRYLAERLEQEGWPALRIAGDVPSTPTRPSTDQRGECLRRFREEPGIRVLVSTEVGSEGLDFQFCHHVVNYDLPWNPMVVEQRIGRIDRFGQRSPVVYVHTLVVEGTVEERILSRLYERIGVFERTIGALEMILGEKFRKLRQDFVRGDLSPQEAGRRVEEVADAVERRAIELENLEKASGHLLGHEEVIRDEMDRVRRLGRFVSGADMIALVRTYLAREHPGTLIREHEGKVFSLKVEEALLSDVSRRGPPRNEFDSFLRSRQKDGRLFFTPDGPTAFERPDVDLVNVSHPLVVAALDALRPMLDDAVSRVGQATLRLDAKEDTEVSDGRHYLLVVAHEVSGVRERRLLDAIAWSEARGAMLDPEIAERLLHLVLQRGSEWEAAQHAAEASEPLWAALLSEARARNARLRKQTEEENEALYQRRLRVHKDERELSVSMSRVRKATAQQRGRPERILQLFEAQIEKAKARYDQEVGALEVHRKPAVRLSDPVGVCVVEVRREAGANRTAGGAQPGESA